MAHTEDFRVICALLCVPLFVQTIMSVQDWGNAAFCVQLECIIITALAFQYQHPT